MNYIKQPRRFTIEIVSCIFVFSFAAIYYYGLHLSLFPDSEYGSLIPFYMYDKFGIIPEYRGSPITSIIGGISYYIWGVGFKGMRMAMTILYMISFMSAFFLSIYSISTKRLKIYLIPIFCFLLVILNPGGSQYLGYHTSYHYHQYVFDHHTEPLIFCMVELVLLEIYFHLNSEKKKKLFIMLVAIIGIIGINETDLLFIINFIVPILFLIAVYLFKRRRKLLFGIIFILSGLLASLRIVSLFIVPLRKIFEVKYLSYGDWMDGGIYGNTGFLDFNDIWNSVSNTFVELCSLYNVELAGKSILSVNTIIGSVRIGILVVICLMAFKCVFKVIKTNMKIEGDMLIDAIISFGFYLNIIIVILASYGVEGRAVRYMVTTVFYGTILLCRHIDEIIDALNINMVYGKVWLACVFSFLIIVNAKPVWKADSYQAEYERTFKDIAKFIQENSLGHGVGGVWYANNLTELMEGKFAVIPVSFSSEGEMELPYNITFNYIVNGQEKDNSHYHAFEDRKIFDLFGQPDETYCIDSFVIYYYEDGLLPGNDIKYCES